MNDADSIFERIRRRVAAGKDCPPEMVAELCSAYEARIAAAQSLKNAFRCISFVSSSTAGVPFVLASTVGASPSNTNPKRSFSQ